MAAERRAAPTRVKRLTGRLEGDLLFFPVFDLLQWLEQAGKTGLLRIEGADGEQSLCLRDGRVIFASSRKKGQRFGEFLASRGSIPEAELRDALEASQREKVTFTRYLIDREIITREALETAMFDLVQTILEELFETRDERHKFTFIDALPAIVSEGVVQFPSGHLIMETARRLDERQRERERQRSRVDELRHGLQRGEFVAPAPPAIFVALTAGSVPAGWTDLVTGDRALAERVARVLDSHVLFMAEDRIDQPLVERIRKLGAMTVGGLVAALELMRTVPGDRYVREIQDVISHCIRSAFLGHAIGTICGVDPGKAFVGGLIHELGKAVILNMEQTEALSDHDRNLLITEAHLTVGEMLGERWGMSREIQAAVRYQNNFRMAGSHRRIAAVIQEAHGLAGYGGGADVRPRFDPDAGDFLGLTRDDVETVSTNVNQILATMF